MIENFFTTKFKVYRLSWSGNKASDTKIGSFYGYKQKVGRGLSENLSISFTKGHLIWCPVDADVFEGDTLLDDNDNYYSVKTINKRDYGNNQHLEIGAEMDVSYASI